MDYYTEVNAGTAGNTDLTSGKHKVTLLKVTQLASVIAKN